MSRCSLNWSYLDPNSVERKIFGFHPTAVKVARWTMNRDVRSFQLKGWKAFADLVEIDPVTGKFLPESTWFIFVGKKRNNQFN